MKENELDSENGATARWRCIEIRNHDGFKIGRPFCWIARHEHCGCDHRHGNINAARGDGWRINTAASEYRALGFLLGTAAMRVGVLCDVNETSQGRSRGDGKDQRRCDPEFGLAEHDR